MTRARLCAAIALALATEGCMGVIQAERNAPGRLTQLAAPPQDLRASAIDHGEDPGSRGWLGHATLMAGGELDKGPGGATAGFELGAAPFSLDKTPSRSDAPFEATARVWLRPSAGWMFFRADGDRDRVGPLYGELQLSIVSRQLGAFMLGIGPRVELAREDAGAQATVCGGIHPALAMFCLRGAAEANRGAELSIFFSVSAFGAWMWSK